MQIVPFDALPDTERIHTGIKAIFFANAATVNFADDAERSAFHELWLGRYLHHFPDMAFIALDRPDHVAGYIVGSSVSNRPPLPGPDYYGQFTDSLTTAYPAHLHVNIHHDFRGQKIGAALIRALRLDCEKRALSGLHAVTLADSPAAHFFVKCGLTPVETIIWNGRKLAFMGKTFFEQA